MSALTRYVSYAHDKPVVMLHIFNPSLWEADPYEFKVNMNEVSSRPGQHSETLSKKKKFYAEQEEHKTPCSATLVRVTRVREHKAQQAAFIANQERSRERMSLRDPVRPYLLKTHITSQ